MMNISRSIVAGLVGLGLSLPAPLIAAPKNAANKKRPAFKTQASRVLEGNAEEPAEGNSPTPVTETAEVAPVNPTPVAPESVQPSSSDQLPPNAAPPSPEPNPETTAPVPVTPALVPATEVAAPAVTTPVAPVAPAAVPTAVTPEPAPAAAPVVKTEDSKAPEATPAATNQTPEPKTEGGQTPEAETGGVKPYELKNRSTFEFPETQRVAFWPIGWKKSGAAAGTPGVDVGKKFPYWDRLKVSSVLLGPPNIVTINGRSYEEGEFVSLNDGKVKFKLLIQQVRNEGAWMLYDRDDQRFLRMYVKQLPDKPRFVETPKLSGDIEIK